LSPLDTLGTLFLHIHSSVSLNCKHLIYLPRIVTRKTSLSATSAWVYL
jgi:hypothetical protein